MSVSIAKSAGPVNVSYQILNVDLKNQTSGFSRSIRFSDTDYTLVRVSAWFRADIASETVNIGYLKISGSDGITDPQILQTSSDVAGCGTISGVIMLGPMQSFLYEVTPDSADPFKFDVKIIVEAL